MVVGIAKGDKPYNFEKILEKSLNSIGGIKKYITPEQKVLIKPNMVTPKFIGLDKPYVTDMRLIEAVIKVLKKNGIENISIGENPACTMRSSMIYYLMGFKDLVKEYNIKWVNLDTEKEVKVKINGKLVKEIKIPKPFLDDDIIINMPKMKTHSLTGFTLAIKNHQGYINDKYKLMYHDRRIEQKLIDIANFFNKKSIVILDGIYAMEGQVPLIGDKVDYGVVMVSDNILEADVIAGHLMGFDSDNKFLDLIEKQFGLNYKNIDVNGIKLSKIRRKFKKSNINFDKYPNITVIDESNNYDGCKQAIKCSIDSLDAEDLIDKIPTITIVTGGSEIPEKYKGDLILVGNSMKDKKIKGCSFVPGSPPAQHKMAEFLRIKYKLLKPPLKITEFHLMFLAYLKHYFEKVKNFF